MAMPRPTRSRNDLCNSPSLPTLKLIEPAPSKALRAVSAPLGGERHKTVRRKRDSHEAFAAYLMGEGVAPGSPSKSQMGASRRPVTEPVKPFRAMSMSLERMPLDRLLDMAVSLDDPSDGASVFAGDENGMPPGAPPDRARINRASKICSTSIPKGLLPSLQPSATSAAAQEERRRKTAAARRNGPLGVSELERKDVLALFAVFEASKQSVRPLRVVASSRSAASLGRDDLTRAGSKGNGAVGFPVASTSFAGVLRASYPAVRGRHALRHCPRCLRTALTMLRVCWHSRCAPMCSSVLSNPR